MLGHAGDFNFSTPFETLKSGSRGTDMRRGFGT